MTMSAFACSSCGEPVPIGRLACPSCGELLASVAGSPRRAVARAEAGSAPAEAALAMAAPDAAEPDGWDAPEAMAEVAETPEPMLLADAPVPAGPAPAPEPTFTLAPEPTFTLTPGSAFEPAPAPEPRWPTEAGPAIEPTGAYPPGSEFTSALRDTEPVDPDAPPTTMAAGAGWGGDGSARWSAAVAAADAPASPPREPGVRAIRIGLPGLGALPERFAEQLTGIAGAVIGVGFVLPWGERVIGSPQVGAPWWSLGVVGSGSWAVFLAVLGGLALATAGHDRAPAWLRLGAVPLGLGALVIGTAWPYLFGPLGGGIGTTAVAIGALAWIVLGLLAVRPPRHPDATPSV